jgi:exodeoxyribonuclease VII small subunit
MSENTYKHSMERLQQILERIDDSETGIDELAEDVREAAEHLKTCRRILKETEFQVNNALQELDADLGEEDSADKSLEN